MKMSWTSCRYEYRVRLEQDVDAENPVKAFDMAGTIVCWHRRYDLGHPHKFSDPDGFLTSLAKDAVSWKYPEHLIESNRGKLIQKNYVLLPVYLYDHSGLSLSTSPFSCPWDSGQVGWIYISMDKARKEWTGTEQKIRERAQACLEAEIETYGQYVSGDVWEFFVERRPLNRADIFDKLDTVYLSDIEADDEADWEHVDSCCGFYGDDPDENGMSEHIVPESYIEDDLKEQLRLELEAINKFADLLTNA